MRKIIIGSSLLFSILLAVPQAHAQESVDVIIHDNGTERREVIDLPKSMTYPVDSLLNDWKAKNYIDLGKDCSTSIVNPEFSDSIYIDRLAERYGLDDFMKKVITAYSELSDDEKKVVKDFIKKINEPDPDKKRLLLVGQDGSAEVEVKDPEGASNALKDLKAKHKK